MLKTHFSGRLGRDAETKHLANGTALASFPVAVDVGYGDKKETIWMDCTIFGKRAESRLIDYLTKGKQVVVSGNLSKREYEGKTYLQCTVDNDGLDLVGGTNEPRESPRQQRAAGPRNMDEGIPSHDDLEDDIPF